MLSHSMHMPTPARVLCNNWDMSLKSNIQKVRGMTIVWEVEEGVCINHCSASPNHLKIIHLSCFSDSVEPVPSAHNTGPTSQYFFLCWLKHLWSHFLRTDHIFDDLWLYSFYRHRMMPLQLQAEPWGSWAFVLCFIRMRDETPRINIMFVVFPSFFPLLLLLQIWLSIDLRRNSNAKFRRNGIHNI